MIIIDTHVWLWLLHDPSQLSDAARAQIEIEEAQNGILVSAISVWEIAVKSSLGKLALPLLIDYIRSTDRLRATGLGIRDFKANSLSRLPTIIRSGIGAKYRGNFSTVRRRRICR